MTLTRWTNEEGLAITLTILILHTAFNDYWTLSISHYMSLVAVRSKQALPLEGMANCLVKAVDWPHSFDLFNCGMPITNRILPRYAAAECSVRNN